MDAHLYSPTGPGQQPHPTPVHDSHTSQDNHETPPPGLAGVVILAGGQGRRLGGVSKADITAGGTRLIDIAADSCTRAGLGNIPTVVVGPASITIPAGMMRVVEDPPLSGPAAGFLAGYRHLVATADQHSHNNKLHTDNSLDAGGHSQFIGLVPVDAPLAPHVLPRLVHAAHAKGSAVMCARAAGQRQNVVAVFSTPGLVKLAGETGCGWSMKRLFTALGSVDECDVEEPFVVDADTPDDLIEVTRLCATYAQTSHTKGHRQP